MVETYHCIGFKGEDLDLEPEAQMSSKMIDQGHLAMSLNDQGLCAMSKGDFYGAIAFHEQALQLMISLCGETNLDVIWVMKHIALMYENMGEYSQALALYEKVLQLRKAVLGENHEYVATSLTDLALLLAKMKKFETALQLHGDALAIRQAVLGVHPATAISLNNLGTICYQMSFHADAMKYYNQSYAMKKTCHLNGHTVATTLLNMAVVLNEMNSCTKALPLLMEASRLCENAMMDKTATVIVMIEKLQTKIMRIVGADSASIESHSSTNSLDHDEVPMPLISRQSTEYVSLTATPTLNNNYLEYDSGSTSSESNENDGNQFYSHTETLCCNNESSCGIGSDSSRSSTPQSVATLDSMDQPAFGDQKRTLYEDFNMST